VTSPARSNACSIQSVTSCSVVTGSPLRARSPRHASAARATPRAAAARGRRRAPHPPPNIPLRPPCRRRGRAARPPTLPVGPTRLSARPTASPARAPRPPRAPATWEHRLGEGIEGGVESGQGVGSGSCRLRQWRRSFRQSAGAPRSVLRDRPDEREWCRRASGRFRSGCWWGYPAPCARAPRV
jgi:hypothetical protein